MNQDTALLVVDMQPGILSRFPETEALLRNVAKAIAVARSRRIPVIFVMVGFRSGAPEISSNNKSFSAGRERFTDRKPEEWMSIDPAIAPLAEEPIVIKRRISAFTGSDLEVLLRAQDIRHIVLSGVSTSGVVLSTLREAADKDYRITVLTDCCADADLEVHRVLTEKVFPRQAALHTSRTWEKED